MHSSSTADEPSEPLPHYGPPPLAHMLEQPPAMLSPGELIRLEAAALVKLSRLHYWLGGFMGILCGVVVLGYCWGLVLLTLFAGWENDQAWNFASLGAICVLIPLVLAVALLLCAQRLGAWKWLNYCLFIVTIEFLLFPFGTVLSIYSLMILSQPRVQRLFDPDLRIWR